MRSAQVANCDCEWLYDLGAARYKFFDDCFKTLDDKAATLIGGGAAIFTILTAIAVTTVQVHYAVSFAAIPSLALMVAAICKVIDSRKAVGAFPPPTMDEAIYYLDNHEGYGNAKAAFAGRWHIVCELIRPRINRKAMLIEESLHCFKRAFLLMILPLVASICVKLFAPTSSVPDTNQTINVQIGASTK